MQGRRSGGPPPRLADWCGVAWPRAVMSHDWAPCVPPNPDTGIMQDVGERARITACRDRSIMTGSRSVNRERVPAPRQTPPRVGGAPISDIMSGPVENTSPAEDFNPIRGLA